jgi:predicted AlkP superfamily pyrophosphatase or phosphodiesterase
VSIPIADPRSSRRLPIVLVLFALAVLAVGAAFKPSIPPTERNAILISWDGALREHVKTNLSRGKLPNLARLVEHGSLVDIDVVGHQTDTKAGHAQLLTGYDPSLTGVYSNTNYRPVPRGFTIFERLRQTFGSDGITTIMLTGKDHNLGSQSAGLVRGADPYYFSRSGISVWDGDQNRPARVVGPKAVAYIDEHATQGRFFLFIHLPDVDAAGHTHGEGSADYDRALAECDRWLGAVLDELSRRGIDDRTLVYVTADHGFDPGAKQHSHAPHIFLASNEGGLHGGQQRDIAPTVLAGLGVNVAKISPALPGKALR